MRAPGAGRFARLLTLAKALVARFSTGQDSLLEAVDRLSSEAQTATRKELQDLEGGWLEAQAEALLAQAQPGRPALHAAGDTPAVRVVSRAVRLSAGTRQAPGPGG